MTTQITTVMTAHSLVRGPVIGEGPDGQLKVAAILREAMGRETKGSDLSAEMVIRLSCGHYRKLAHNDPTQSSAEFWCNECDGMRNFDSANRDDSVWWDAYRINYPGASNPSGVARTLYQAIITVREAGYNPKDHAGIRAIAGQLNFLLGLSLGPEFGDLDAIKANAKRLDIYVEGL